jgi:hypothetical protein
VLSLWCAYDMARRSANFNFLIGEDQFADTDISRNSLFQHPRVLLGSQNVRIRADEITRRVSQAGRMAPAMLMPQFQ